MGGGVCGEGGQITHYLDEKFALTDKLVNDDNATKRDLVYAPTPQQCYIVVLFLCFIHTEFNWKTGEKLDKSF
jgi:hypothetical protein